MIWKTNLIIFIFKRDNGPRGGVHPPTWPTLHLCAQHVIVSESILSVNLFQLRVTIPKMS